MFGSDCSAEVERLPHDCQADGLIPAGRRAFFFIFFLFLSYLTFLP